MNICQQPRQKVNLGASTPQRTSSGAPVQKPTYKIFPGAQNTDPESVRFWWTKACENVQNSNDPKGPLPAPMTLGVEDTRVAQAMADAMTKTIAEEFGDVNQPDMDDTIVNPLCTHCLMVCSWTWEAKYSSSQEHNLHAAQQRAEKLRLKKAGKLVQSQKIKVPRKRNAVVQCKNGGHECGNTGGGGDCEFNGGPCSSKSYREQMRKDVLGINGEHTSECTCAYCLTTCNAKFWVSSDPTTLRKELVKAILKNFKRITAAAGGSSSQNFSK